MMQLYYVNTFLSKHMLGNPAAVLLLDQWLPDTELQSIATSIGLPATAFLIYEKNKFCIRWFTPDYELDICGHATMAAAHVIFDKIQSESRQIDFDGRTSVKAKHENNLIFLDFPKKNIEPCPGMALLTQGLGIKPKYIYQHQSERCLAVFETEEEVRILKPDMSLLRQLPYRGIDVTAQGKDVDFICRTFYPRKAMTEDAVCGAAHCLLVPYWAKRLNKINLHSHQASERGGELFC